MKNYPDATEPTDPNALIAYVKLPSPVFEIVDQPILSKPEREMSKDIGYDGMIHSPPASFDLLFHALLHDLAEDDFFRYL